MNDAQREDIARGLDGLGFNLAATVVRANAELVNGWHCEACGTFLTERKLGWDERVHEQRTLDGGKDETIYPRCPNCIAEDDASLTPAAAVIAPRVIPQEATPA